MVVDLGYFLGFSYKKRVFVRIMGVRYFIVEGEFIWMWEDLRKGRKEEG